MTQIDTSTEAVEALADRIEELEKHSAFLEAKLRKSAMQELSALGQAQDAHQAQLEAEAKLAKAVETLKFYAEADNYEDQHKPESCGCCYYLHDAEIKEDQGAKARTTLAELTGGKDE